MNQSTGLGDHRVVLLVLLGCGRPRNEGASRLESAGPSRVVALLQDEFTLGLPVRAAGDPVGGGDLRHGQSVRCITPPAPRVKPPSGRGSWGARLGDHDRGAVRQGAHDVAAH